MKRYAIWDKVSPVIVPTGAIFTPDQWKEQYPVAALDSITVVCAAGEINGGFFQNTANSKQALLSMGNNLKYANNQKITLSGGTFVNWNPLDSAFARPWTNPDVPALIVLAEGYQMISETQANGDIWYTVVPI